MTLPASGDGVALVLVFTGRTPVVVFNSVIQSLLPDPGTPGLVAVPENATGEMKPCGIWPIEGGT